MASSMVRRDGGIGLTLSEYEARELAALLASQTELWLPYPPGTVGLAELLPKLIEEYTRGNKEARDE